MIKTVLLSEGADIVMKQMIGTESTPFPKHTASHESALVLQQGSCTITFPDAVHELKSGDTFIVPADDVHQVVGTPDFTAVHIMPKTIRFNFNA